MKMKSFILGIAFAAIAQVTFGQSIVGTSHDMSGQSWMTGNTNKVCGTCHVPHNALTISQAPLWSHDTSSAAYTMYTNAVSSTFNAIPSPRPDGNSKLCLSCHDGTVAINSFIGNGAPSSGTMGVAFPGSTALVGTDLTNDHPISFTYDAALVAVDGGLNAITTNVPSLNGTISSKMLFGGKMQCASCHNPHDNSQGYFQRMANNNSELCLTCHNK